MVLSAAIGIIFALPWSRRFITRRFWCVLARHRFHRLCWEARLHTRAGRLPVVLWTRPTKVGERLFVWCRAGIAAEDFEQHTGELRAACYARDARVTRNTSWSQLVTIDIIRRDTLAAKHQVGIPADPAVGRLRRRAGQPASGGTPAISTWSRLRPTAARRPGRKSQHPLNPTSTAHGGPLRGTATRARPGRRPRHDRNTHHPGRVPVFPFSIFDPVHVGMDEFGEQVHVELAERTS